MEIILLMDNETDYNISEDFFISLAESAIKQEDKLPSSNCRNIFSTYR